MYRCIYNDLTQHGKNDDKTVISINGYRRNSTYLNTLV